MKKILVLLLALIMMGSLCVPVFADTEEEDLKNAESRMNEAEYYISIGDYYEAGWSYALAGHCYAHCLHYSEAAAAYLAAAEAFETSGNESMASTMLDNYDDYKDRGTGSIFSEGSLTIIVGIATAVIFGLGGFFIGRKSKMASNKL